MANSISRTMLIAEANRRGMSITYFGRRNFYCRVTDTVTNRSEMFYGTMPLRTSAHGFITSRNKDLTLDYVSSLGYSLPPYCVMTDRNMNEAISFMVQHDQIVVKPGDSSKSIGVTVGVSTVDMLRQAIDHAFSHTSSGKIILQKHITGNLYRMFIINGRMVAAARRIAPHVTGNGKATLIQLIEQINKDPRRSKSSASPLKKIDVHEAIRYVGEANAYAVVPRGSTVRVHPIDSISVGGEAADVTADVHYDWREICHSITAGINLFVCGFDIMCDDISKPVKNSYIPLLELNSIPGFKLHQYPTAGGKPINLAAVLFDELFGVA